MDIIESEPQRTDINEQAGTPTVRFTIDECSFVLPYAYFIRAEIHVRAGERYLVVGHWSSAKVTVVGRHLGQLAQWLAEYRLVSVILRTDVQASAQTDAPNIEQILVDVSENSLSVGKTSSKRRKVRSESVGRP